MAVEILWSCMRMILCYVMGNVRLIYFLSLAIYVNRCTRVRLKDSARCAGTTAAVSSKSASTLAL